MIAGAPVYTPLTYSNAILRVQAFHAKPESNLLPAHAALIHDAVLAACDAQDGIKDGILNDPRTCTWDPGELVGSLKPEKLLVLANHRISGALPLVKVRQWIFEVKAKQMRVLSDNSR